MTEPELYVSTDKTLKEAKDWLRARLDRGARCPCCTQHAQVYKRHLNAPMAAGLILLYRATAPGFEWIHITELIKRFAGFAVSGRGDFAKLVYWKLILEAERGDADDKRSSGYWRITDAGVDFVRGLSTVPSYMKVYDSRALGASEKMVSIRDCLKKKFSYEELMNGGS